MHQCLLSTVIMVDTVDGSVIYIYIFVCACVRACVRVCVCVCVCESHSVAKRRAASVFT